MFTTKYSSSNEIKFAHSLDNDAEKTIRGVLSDYGFTFPDWESFHSSVEVFKPHIFNFFCTHGKLIYLASPRPKCYELRVRGFNPVDLWPVKVEKYQVHQDMYVFCRGDSYDIAEARFRSCVVDMLDYFNG